MMDREVLKLNMNRLKDCLGDAIGSLGYTSLRGDEDTRPYNRLEYPFGRVAPVQIVGVEGRDEGMATCRVEVRLAAIAPSIDPMAVEDLEDMMCCDAVALYSVVAEDDAVCACSGFRCAPDRSRQSPHGEVGVRVQFDVGLRFGRM